VWPHAGPMAGPRGAAV